MFLVPQKLKTAIRWLTKERILPAAMAFTDCRQHFHLGRQGFKARSLHKPVPSVSTDLTFFNKYSAIGRSIGDTLYQ